MREFFGLEVENGGYLREPEGYFSWQHLVFVTLICLTAILLGVLLGKRRRNRSDREEESCADGGGVVHGCSGAL